MKTTTGGYISPDDAEAFYLSVVGDPALAEKYWDTIPPVVRILATIFNDELSDRKWDLLPQWVKKLCVKTTHEKVEIVRNVVRDLVIELEARQDEIPEATTS